ncbi:MAG TPA: chorismate synthase [Anaerolineales bacterium]|nr:chorismate synthase [Anaerolineales bacterium]
MPLRFLTAGESHGPALLAILEGMPAGLALDIDQLNDELTRRQRGYGAGPRMKIERDRVRILGGLMQGITTGAPLAFQIENRDHSKWRDKEIEPFTIPRPGHVDLAGTLKYGYRDLRPALERASARETAARVAVGAICKQLLAQFGVQVGGYVVVIGEIEADLSALTLAERLKRAEESDVRCPEPQAAQAMHARIEQVIQSRDTLGGIVEVIALGVPPGLGSHVHWDRRLETRLGAAALSVPAIKGVEIGPAFLNARLTGTQVHDPIRLEGGELIRPSNRAGGVEGGITTGQPLLIRAAMKPIATTLTPQQSVDLASGKQVDTQYERSDFCPVPRAVPILEAVTAFVLAEALLEKLGGDSLDEMLPRFAALRRARLSDLPMDDIPHTFWPDEEDHAG